MPQQHTEAAFETAIEHHLLTVAGYTQGDRDTFDLQRGLDPTVLLPFIQETQSKEWAYLHNIQGDKAEETLLDDLCRALDSPHEGCLAVLRHGFKCFGKLFHVAYFAPASGLNPETQILYAANRLTVTRQLRYSPRHKNTLDLTLSLNGIPVATAELKNPMTGQTWRDAVASTNRSHDSAEKSDKFNAEAQGRKFLSQTSQCLQIKCCLKISAPLRLCVKNRPFCRGVFRKGTMFSLPER